MLEYNSLITEDPQTIWSLTLQGGFLMQFLGKKSAKDFGLPEYLEPQPSEGSLPDKR